MSTCITVRHTDNYLFVKKTVSISKSFVSHRKVFHCDNYENVKFNRKGFYSNIMYLYLPFKRLHVHDRILINQKGMTIKPGSIINLNPLC